MEKSGVIEGTDPIIYLSIIHDIVIKYMYIYSLYTNNGYTHPP